jgi:hypothetical protein
MDPIRGLQYGFHERSRIQSQLSLSLIKGIHPERSASNTPSSIVPDNTTVQGIQYDAAGWGGSSADTPQGPYVSTPKSNIWPARLVDNDESEAEPEVTPVPPLPLSQSTQPTHHQPMGQNQIGLYPRQRPRNDQDDSNDPWAQEDPPDKGTPPDESSHK